MNGSVVGLMVVVMVVVAAGAIMIYIAAGGPSVDDPEFRREVEDLIRNEPALESWSDTRKYRYVQERTGVSLKAWNEMYPRWSVSREAAEAAGFTGLGPGLGGGWTPPEVPHASGDIDFSRPGRRFRKR